MAISDSNYGRVAFIPEVTFGTTPSSPNLQIARLTSADFAATKETVVSNELRTDRMVSSLVETSAMSGGSLGIELSLGGSYDAFIEAALGGTWSTLVNITATNTDFAVNSGTKVVTVAAAGTPTANVSVGQWVFVQGAAAAGNNGWFKVTAKTNTTLTFGDATTLVTVAAGANGGSVTIKGKNVKNGIVKRSFSIEQAFTDVNQFFLFRGQRVGTMSLDISSGAIVTGSFGFQGLTSTRADTTFATGTTASTTTQVVNATANVGSLVEAGVPLVTGIQSISLNLDNALRNQMAVGNKFPIGVGYGRQTVSGSITAYFEDGALYDKFLNHSTSSLSFNVSDGNGQSMRIELPRVYFASASPTLAGIDQDVVMNLEFTAVIDPTLNAQISIDMA